MPTLLTEQTSIGELLFTWEVPEYEEHERPRSWYIIMVILGVGLLIFGIVTNNFLFSLIIILFGIILFLQSQTAPLTVPVAIAELGVLVGRKFYPYSEFLSFYIIFLSDSEKTLFLETKQLFRPRLQLPLGSLSAIAVRDSLKQVLQEDIEKEEEPFSEQMRRMWRIH